MTGTFADEVRDRLAALWDATPTTRIIGSLITISIVAFLTASLIGRTSGGDVTEGSGSEQQPEPAAPTDTFAAPPESATAGGFHVIGADIVDPDGNVFIPVGVNGAIKVTDYPYVFEGGNGGLNGQVDAAQAWGWNTVRATLRCADETGEPSTATVVDGIDETVREYTAAGIVVILACHDGTGSDVTLDSELDLAVRLFWDEVVPRYRDNPYVWFNFYNEPQARFDPDSWVELHRFYYDRYRSEGVDNVMVFDLPNYGQGVDLVADNTFADDLGAACNTVLGWHAWGSLSGRQATEDEYLARAEALLDRDLAVTVTEAGVPQPLSAGTAGNPEWNESGYYAALEVANTLPIGLLWWHGTGDTSDELFYPLKADKSGFWTSNNSGALTAAGATFWDYSQQEPTVDTFDIPDIPCPADGG